MWRPEEFEFIGRNLKGEVESLFYRRGAEALSDGRGGARPYRVNSEKSKA